ncbi:MAG: elongation factor 1-alpha C-terminal domain-related protein, partial [Bryobacteraceae bacterium]
SALHLNEIGAVAIETHKPLFFDAYRNNRTTGSLILIDPVTNATVAAGMIVERAREDRRSKSTLTVGVEIEKSRLTPAERFGRFGHRPVTIWLTARVDVAYMLERELFDRGCIVHVLEDEVDSHLLPELAKMASTAGLITICSIASTEPEERERARSLVGENHFVDVDPQRLSVHDDEAASQLCRMLEDRGFIPKDHRGTSGDGI